MHNIQTNILDSLNPAQHEAVTAESNNLLVLAGAGSGKTRVLTHRTAWLIQNKQVSPFAILAVTFTNKAANEMRERIGKLTNLATNGMWIGTFHSLAHRLLRLHWQDVNLPETFQIIDSEDQYRLIRRVMKNLNLDETHWPPKQAQWYINHKKDEGIRSQHMEEATDLFEQTMQKIYTAYEKSCQKSGLVDFAELLLRSHELWLNHPNILNHYSQRFQHILVDEFQDTNTIQYAWIRMLVNDANKIMVVGDDDQSIYGWRGAKIDNIHHFLKDFNNTKTIRLEQNYRSTNNILKTANAVIKPNTNRMGKNLWTEAGNGELITLYAGFNARDEAGFAINQILDLTRQDYKLSDCAILYRSNAQSRIFEETLIQMNVPYRIYGGTRFFERAEIKNALAYLRLIANSNDDDAFERVVNTPTRGIGHTTIDKIRQFAREKDISLWQSAKKIVHEDLLTSRACNAITAFLNLIDKFSVETAQLTLHEQTEHVLQLSGLFEFYLKNKNEKSQTRIENLKELISATKAFVTDEKEDTPILTSFLTHAALEAGEAQADATSDCVQLMTLHSAKGLEFPIVFLTGLEEGLFPHKMSLDTPDGLEEERRLCYVGITRAMQKLFLTYANSRMIHGFELNQRPSQFLASLPHECIEETYMRAKVSRPISYQTTSKQTTKIDYIPNPGFQLGQTVTHKKFGHGVILNFESATRVRVNFKRYGTKTLDLNYANLEPA